MAKDKDDDKLDREYTLEEILAEYGKDPGKPSGPDLPWPEARHDPLPQNVVLFPGGRQVSPPEEDEEPEASPGGEPDPEDGGEPEPAPAPEPPPKVRQRPPVTDKVLEFPEDDTPPLQAGLRHLREKADAYAQQMFSEEGKEVSEETIRFERLIPGVDEEEAAEEEAPRRERRPRKEPAPPPDIPPSQLASRYGKGLGLLRLRAALVLLLSLPLLWVALASFLDLPLPGGLGESFALQVWCSGGVLTVAAVLGIDVLLLGLVRLFVLRPGADSACALACCFTLADAFTQLQLMPERDTLPYAAACCLGLFCCMWGTYDKRQGLRLSCRTAASASEPYLVTLDPKSWNGRDAYAKWSGPAHGFGSQIQEEDGTQKVYRITVPLLLLGSLLCALLASVGQGRPERFLWCLSADLTASAAFAGLLIFSRPYLALARRLSGSGAALAGWSGAARAGSAILLTDTDLFPPGTVALNGIKVFGDFSVEKVVAVCATLIRDSGSGLDKLFHDLLRSQGAVYRRASGLQRHEGGGLSAEIRGESILVGSASFMALMEVPLPQGLNVRSAVFCAIDGELAGIFALSYTMHPTIPPAISALVAGRISPVLCTRDFNLIPAMLRQKFKLPVEKMDFPTVERRTELSDPDQPHNPRLTAVLCREGLTPFSEAVVGAKRLRSAVRVATVLSVLGSLVGLLLAFYLTFVGAWQSITPAHNPFSPPAWPAPPRHRSDGVGRNKKNPRGGARDFESGAPLFYGSPYGRGSSFFTTAGTPAARV